MMRVLEFIDTYRKVYDFAEIIPASALRAKNLDDGLSIFSNICRMDRQFYDEDTMTDQPQRRSLQRLSVKKHFHAFR